MFCTWWSGNKALMWTLLPAHAFMILPSWPLELLMWPGDIALQAGNRKFVMDYSLQFKLLTLFNPLVGLPSPLARHAAAALIGSVPALPDSPPSLTEVLSSVGAREESGALVFGLWSISSSSPLKRKTRWALCCAQKIINASRFYGVFFFGIRAKAIRGNWGPVVKFHFSFKAHSAQTCDIHCSLSHSLSLPIFLNQQIS